MDDLVAEFEERIRDDENVVASELTLTDSDFECNCSLCHEAWDSEKEED